MQDLTIKKATVSLVKIDVINDDISIKNEVADAESHTQNEIQISLCGNQSILLKNCFLQDFICKNLSQYESQPSKVQIQFDSVGSIALIQLFAALSSLKNCQIVSLPASNSLLQGVNFEIQDLELRKQIIEQARKMNEAKINQGTSGNISARTENGFLITPSGQDYSTMQPQDIVFMDMEGNYYGLKNPSSEWRFHHDIYFYKKDAQSILHAHPLFCTALSVHQLTIPNFHYMVCLAGGYDIKCASYATFGTKQLSENILVALTDRHACLMANHGMVCYSNVGIQKVLGLAIEVENLAQQYWYSMQLGKVQLLSMEEMIKVQKKFETYGKQFTQEEYAKMDNETAVIPPPCKGKYQPIIKKNINLQ